MKKIFLTFFFLTILVLTAFYLTQKVNYCRPIKIEEISEEHSDAIYTSGELQEFFIEASSKPLFFRTTGESMLNSIKPNNVCLCVPKEEYYVGDIVAFFYQKGEEFQGVLHRIIKIDGDEITTKGDNNKEPDPSITSDSLLCYVPKVKRWETLW